MLPVIEFPNCYDRYSLGEVYEDTFRAKQKHGGEDDYLDPAYDFETLEAQVLHDANCLKNLKCDGQNPFDSENVFVTCDYRLARIRRLRSGQYAFLVTVSEYIEFMMPCLFLADALGSEPIKMPNFLLAGAISQDLSGSKGNIDSLRLQMVSNPEPNKDTAILSTILNNKRFERVRTRLEKTTLSAEETRETGEDIAVIFAEYDNRLGTEIVRRVVRDERQQLRDEVEKLRAENGELTRKNELLSEKKKKQDSYKAKQQKRNHR